MQEPGVYEINSLQIVSSSRSCVRVQVRGKGESGENTRENGADPFIPRWPAHVRFGCQFFGGRFPRPSFARDLAKSRSGRAQAGPGEPKLVANQTMTKKAGLTNNLVRLLLVAIQTGPKFICYVHLGG
jgi:hypothetical protein